MIQELPEEIQERFARVAAHFVAKHHVPLADVSELMMDVIQIYLDYRNEDKDPS